MVGCIFVIWCISTSLIMHPCFLSDYSIHSESFHFPCHFLLLSEKMFHIVGILFISYYLCTEKESTTLIEINIWKPSKTPFILNRMHNSRISASPHTLQSNKMECLLSRGLSPMSTNNASQKGSPLSSWTRIPWYMIARVPARGCR